MFANVKIFALAAGFFVLFAPFLALAPFDVHLPGVKAAHKTHRSHHFGQPDFVFFCLHQPAGIVFLQMNVAAIHINRKRKLRDIFIVEAPGFKIVAARPFHQVLGVFALAVGKGGDVGHIQFLVFNTGI